LRVYSSELLVGIPLLCSAIQLGLFSVISTHSHAEDSVFRLVFWLSNRESPFDHSGPGISPGGISPGGISPGGISPFDHFGRGISPGGISPFDHFVGASRPVASRRLTVSVRASRPNHFGRCRGV
jgi:hypothetical protein